MKLRNFLKLIAMALLVPSAFIACSDEDNYEINVDPIVGVTSVTLDKTALAVEVGESATLSATIEPANATFTNLTWTSSDTNVATVADGKVTGVHHGHATITASAGNASATCNVYVEGDGVLVFNSGSMFSGIEGSLTLIRSGFDVTNKVFSTVNGRSLGSIVQDGVVCGDNLYIAVDGSNTIEVVNKYTFESVAIVMLPEDEGEPRDIIEEDGMVYISMYTGFVARLDPTTNTIDKTVKVGPNPEEMAVAGDYLYVVNSDGLNYEANYVNGKSVSKIDLRTFTEVKKIPVGLNPTKIVEANDNLYVLCMGNYYDVPSDLYKIDASDNVTDLGIEGTFMAEDDDVLYVIYYPYYEEGTSYTSYNLSDMSVKSSAFVDTRLDAPAGIAVENGRIYISSYSLVDGWASYTTDGYLNEYTTDGTFVKKYDVGVGPANIYVMD